MTHAQYESQKSEVRSAICVGKTDFTLSDKSSVTSFMEFGTIEGTENIGSFRLRTCRQ